MRYRTDWQRVLAARRIRRWRFVIVCVAALAMAVAAGVSAGRSVAPEGSAGVPRRVVSVGAATLMVPPEWQTVPGERVGSWPETTAVLAPSSGSAGRMIVAVAPADDVSLVPGALRGLIADARLEPRSVRLAGYRAWRYPALRGRASDRVVDVVVLPTARDVIAIACVSVRSGLESGAMDDCAAAVSSVAFSGSAILVPTRDLAFRLRLPRVLAQFDARRVRARSELRRTAASGTRARVASRLARAHRAAADALRPLGADPRPLVEPLSEAAGAYDGLEHALRGRSASQLDAARREVNTADAGVADAVERLATADQRVLAVQTHAGTRPRPEPRRDSSAVVILLIAALVLLGIAMAATVAERRLLSRASRSHAGRSADARAQPSATGDASSRPAVAPPADHVGAAGRWDAPPTSRPAALPNAVDDEPQHQTASSRSEQRLVGTRRSD